MACIRLKRLRSDDPAESIAVTCKKRRVSVSVVQSKEEETPIKTVLKFVGTVNSKSDSDSIESHINKSNADETNKSSFLLPRIHRNRAKSKPNVLAKNKAESKTIQEEARYKLISDIRGLKAEKTTTDTDSREGASASRGTLFHLYDAVAVDSDDEEAVDRKRVLPKEDQITCNDVPMVVVAGASRGIADPYVYDIYYTNDVSVKGFESLEDPIWIERYGKHEEVVFDDGASDSDERADDDDDSNDESNWRNDYPDEEDVYDDDEGPRNYFRDDVCEYDDVVDQLDQFNIDSYDEDDDDSHDEDDDDSHDEIRTVEIDEGFARIHGLYVATLQAKLKLNTEQGVPLDKIKAIRKYQFI